MPEWLLPALAMLAAAMSSVVAWGFLTGRFVQKSEGVFEALSRLEGRLEGEHAERKRTIETINVTLGVLQMELARHDERVKSQEREG